MCPLDGSERRNLNLFSRSKPVDRGDQCFHVDWLRQIHFCTSCQKGFLIKILELLRTRMEQADAASAAAGFHSVIAGVGIDDLALKIASDSKSSDSAVSDSELAKLDAFYVRGDFFGSDTHPLDEIDGFIDVDDATLRDLAETRRKSR